MLRDGVMPDDRRPPIAFHALTVSRFSASGHFDQFLHQLGQLFFRQQSCPSPYDLAIGSNEIGAGHASHLEFPHYSSLIGGANRVVDAQLLHQALTVLIAAQSGEGSNVQAQEDDFIAEFLVDGLQVGHFQPAGRAQAGPEVQDYRSALTQQFGQIQRLATQRVLALVGGDGNVGRQGFSDVCVGLEGIAGCSRIPVCPKKLSRDRTDGTPNNKAAHHQWAAF